ncbi:MAG TPA: ribonuclease T2 [Paracoccaceae bacterium]|nr:ribonuclease T2 [Paracoccaceae bacterium]HMO70474.1 ribonuclease T2 [Paracoccaceae bacterium]
MGYRTARAAWKALICALALAAAAPAEAEGEPAGRFDYYVLALSWSPTWCALTGDMRGTPEPQCAAGAGRDFVVHGLWPQAERGWPSFCRTVQRDPTRAETAAAADLFGGAGQAFYQWKKHGRCSGLAPADYFALARRARASVQTPPVLREVKRRLAVPAEVIERAFLERNPVLTGDMVRVTCRAGLIEEIRVCLTKDLNPRTCSASVAPDCRLPDAGLLPPR